MIAELKRCIVLRSGSRSGDEVRTRCSLYTIFEVRSLYDDMLALNGLRRPTMKGWIVRRGPRITVPAVAQPHPYPPAKRPAHGGSS